MNVTKIIDFLTSKNVEGYYGIYKDTQWYSKQEMTLLQVNKLKSLVYHCYENIPYYRNYMLANSIKPEDISSLEDITLFPLLTKEIIKENYNQFIPKNINEIKTVKTSQTGGTTGNILFTKTDANTRSSTWATFKRFHDWMGIKQGDKSLILMGGHVVGRNYYDKFKNYVNNYLTNSISFNPYNTSEENIEQIIHALQNNQFSMIRSYSQFLFSLSIRLKSMGLTFNIKAITTTAEPLMPEHRALFQEVFNAEVFDQYGCGEIGGIAYECGAHNGLHIADERVIVELNEKKELIITDLDNFAMPFIRYINADQAIISDAECSCGRKSSLIKQVMGRTCDYMIGMNGEFLHWAYFWHLFFDSEIAEKRSLKKFQIVQEAKDRLLVRLVCDNLSNAEQLLLTTNIRQRMGAISISYSFEEDIENAASGKYRPVVNKLL